MSTPSIKTYRVIVLESTGYRVIIDADSQEAAEAKVRAMWDRGDTEQFSVREISLDYIEAEEGGAA